MTQHPPIDNRFQYVFTDAVDALSDAELEAVIEEGGPADLIEYARKEYARRNPDPFEGLDMTRTSVDGPR